MNFVEQIDEDTFKVRTYERGVENETLACGTGVTAVAIAMHKIKKTESNSIKLLVEGGELEVSFSVENNNYKNVFLKGVAQFVFLKGNEKPEVSYAKRKGKYMKQKGVTLPKV